MASIKRIGNELASPLDSRIYTVRGQRVMLDSDLAGVYGVETRHINQAVDRNEHRFPPRYAFRLTTDEGENLKSQIVTSRSWGGRRKLPQVFTEHGAVMLASVLSSPRAIQASIVVVDAFVRLRHVLDANHALAKRIDELAAKVDDHDKAFAVVFEELKRLAVDMAPERPRERIDFRSNKERGITGRARGK
ncbi:MAG: ORF6N domain-containing protein [Planctomycetota bacterium]|jgi:hypothetical protein|nr:ORF6N domain-containing protein [Planctomycetota bacterium]